MTIYGSFTVSAQGLGRLTNFREHVCQKKRLN